MYQKKCTRIIYRDVIACQESWIIKEEVQFVSYEPAGWNHCSGKFKFSKISCLWSDKASSTNLLAMSSV